MSLRSTKNLLQGPAFTLDLHGSTKSEGICRTTEFLDRIRRQQGQNKKSEVWVLIVTGSGSHSQEGPVLRGAIENLLIKRSIKYHQMRGRGSFLVNALSGLVLYEPDQPKDSKVIVANPLHHYDFYDEDIHLDNEIGRDRRQVRTKIPTIKPFSLTQQLGPAMDEISRAGTDNGNRNRYSYDNKSLKKAFGKQKKEESAYQRAISESLAENQQAEKADEELLKRAFNLSLLDKSREMKREIEEQLNLKQVIDDSRREVLIQSEEEEYQLMRVKELSKSEFEQRNSISEISDEDECFLRAIELSRDESNQESNEIMSAIEQSILDHKKHEENEEKLLLKALKQSVVEP